MLRVLIVLALLAGGWYVIRLVKRFCRFLMQSSLMCQFCGSTDMKMWDQLSEGLQKKILAYFRSHERRKPDTRGVFVCDECGTVFDDFSGMREDPEVDTEGAGSHTVISMRAWCKVCGSLMQGCDPDNDNIHCRTCETRYEWKEHGKSGYRFLMPPKKAKVRKRSGDLSGVG
ncbi:MAG: hypothetical protein HN380_30865 [Victivallales bacterium]|jgi:hypothetical protein|nr:hypothetical protein [Victivallales bacterium]